MANVKDISQELRVACKIFWIFIWCFHRGLQCVSALRKRPCETAIQKTAGDESAVSATRPLVTQNVFSPVPYLGIASYWRAVLSALFWGQNRKLWKIHGF